MSDPEATMVQFLWRFKGLGFRVYAMQSQGQIAVKHKALSAQALLIGHDSM